MRLSTAVVLGVALVGPSLLAGEPVWNMETWNVRDHIPLGRFVMQAHRGAGDLAPEGSREAFELAWRLGCIPEADLRRTRDGRIVSFHDNDLARILPNAPAELKKKGIADLTWE
ncbi:MAG TPA: glycerophosphodiester phosphodiesterase family protein, partial [Clostridia bacterium]|nr:glycerophosphodiester phosphodiesterase family protein [Clostridia bacterium]